VGGVPAQIESLKKRLTSSGDAAERERLATQIAIQQNHLEGTNAVKPAPPNVTLNDRLTLHLGGA
jgi:hypothetical protein